METGQDLYHNPQFDHARSGMIREMPKVVQELPGVELRKQVEFGETLYPRIDQVKTETQL